MEVDTTSQRWRFLATAAGLHLLLEDLEFITKSQCNAPHKSAKHLPWLWIDLNLSHKIDTNQCCFTWQKYSKYTSFFTHYATISCKQFNKRYFEFWWAHNALSYFHQSSYTITQLKNTWNRWTENEVNFRKIHGRPTINIMIYRYLASNIKNEKFMTDFLKIE